jgi:hypothetical protein
MLPFLKRKEGCVFCAVTRYALVFALGMVFGMVYERMRRTGVFGL